MRAGSGVVVSVLDICLFSFLFSNVHRSTKGVSVLDICLLSFSTVGGLNRRSLSLHLTRVELVSKSPKRKRRLKSCRRHRHSCKCVVYK